MSTPAEQPVMLRHGRIRLALFRLRDATDTAPGGQPLLILHDLGCASPASVPDEIQAWPGPVYALDFTGHGRSSVPRGGGYTCEVLLGDADTALTHIGPCTVYGRGLGGYIGLLLAGARAVSVRGVIVDDGPGLAGGPTTGQSASIPFADPAEHAAVPTPDPYALLELSTDVRPPDYAVFFAAAAAQGSAMNPAVAVVARVRAPWLSAVLEQFGTETMSLPEAIRVYGTR